MMTGLICLLFVERLQLMLVEKKVKVVTCTNSGFSFFTSCMGIYMDTLNIFTRLVMILANGGGRRK